MALAARLGTTAAPNKGQKEKDTVQRCKTAVIVSTLVLAHRCLLTPMALAARPGTTAAPNQGQKEGGTELICKRAVRVFMLVLAHRLLAYTNGD